MKTPWGKEGGRRRMYHPRFGRWIVQTIVDVALSCTSLRVRRNTEKYSKMMTHDNVFQDFIVRQESFLHTCEVSCAVPQASGVSLGCTLLALYQITLSDPSMLTLIRMSSSTSELRQAMKSPHSAHAT